MIRRLIAALSAATCLASPAFAFTAGHIVTYSDTTGAHVQDSGSVLQAPAISLSAFGGSAVNGNAQYTTGQGGAGVMGFFYNDAPNSTTVLPAGTIGYGYNLNNGNIVFGMYGLAENHAASGVDVAAEFTARNDCGAPDTNLPPNEAVGTPTCASMGLQVTAGGNNNSSVGIQISSEGGSTKVFNTAEYIVNYGQYGLFIDTPASGTLTSAYMKGNGNGNVLVLQTTAEPTASNAVFTVQNHSSQNLFGVREDGNLNAGTGPAVSVSCSANSVSLTTLVVTSGIVTHC